MAEDNEYKLIEKAADGDVDAFSELVDLYTARIYSVCFSSLGNRQDAEDCTQDTFIKAFRAIDRFNFRASFYTWIYRIAVNTCHDFRRKHHKVFFQSLDQEMETDDSTVTFQIADDAPLPDEQIEQKETRQLVREEIDKLPDYLAQILILRDLEDLSYQELADVLDLNIGTVKSRLARARQQLMEQLRDREQLSRRSRLKTDRPAGRSERR